MAKQLDADRIVRLYKQGMSINAIANKVGSWFQSVKNVLINEGALKGATKVAKVKKEAAGGRAYGGNDGARKAVIKRLKKLFPEARIGTAGWPDIWMIKADGKASFIEAKQDGDLMRDSQKECHDVFQAARIQVEIWSPGMLDEIIRMARKDGRSEAEEEQRRSELMGSQELGREIKEKLAGKVSS